MISLAFIAFVFLVVVYADYRMTKYSIGVQCGNGLSAVAQVLHGHSSAPTQYRILVPWLCLLFAGKRECWQDYTMTYFRIKQAGILLALSASWIYFVSVGVDPFLGVALLGMFFVLASLYDYADIYYEVGLLATAFAIIQYNPEWLLLGLMPLTVLAALNKETGVVIPAVCLLSGNLTTGLILSFVFYLGYKIPRIVYGARERHCEWIMLKRNLATLRGSLESPILYNEYTFFAFLVVVGAALYAFSYPWTPIEIVLAGMAIGSLVPTMWREIRVFAPVTLALIPMAVRAL